MGDGDAKVRHNRLQALGALVQSLDSVVDEEDLTAAARLAQDCFSNSVIIPAAREGTDGSPVRRRGGDEREVSHSSDGELKRSRDRRRRERQHIDGLLELLDALFVGDAEALLFVDDQEPEVAEVDVFA